MSFSERTCDQFIKELASKAPVPGGGGASALAGALGMALGSMVGNLTLGKKKYAAVQEDIECILQNAEALQRDLMALIDDDAEAFYPLSQAYSLPTETEEDRAHKEAVMEEAIKNACLAPLAIMEKAMQAIALHGELLQKGSRMMVSDVGVGVLLCKTALMGASLNVLINTKSMRNAAVAERMNSKVDAMLRRGMAQADEIYAGVLAQIK